MPSHRPLIDVRILDERIRDSLPAYATPGAAGMDLRACLEAPVTLGPGDVHLVPTGIAIHIGDPGYAALIERATGRPLDAAIFKRHLEARYLS